MQHVYAKLSRNLSQALTSAYQTVQKKHIESGGKYPASEVLSVEVEGVGVIVNGSMKVLEIGLKMDIEDKDDAFVVSMGSKEKLNESTRQLISTLERAVELGMHQEELILDGEIPGKSLDAKILITTLCKQNEVHYN